MSVDELSISFASSIGIDNIKEEYRIAAAQRTNNLYTDLDQLEKSVDAEFEQYINQARSFPFHEQVLSSREHLELKDTSIHSDCDILGADLLDQVNDKLDLEDASWQRFLKNNDVDENYNVKPLRNNSTKEQEVESRNTSPGQYFAARSMPLNSMNYVWQQQQQQQQQHEISSHSYQSHHTHQSLHSRYSRRSQAEPNAYSYTSQNPNQKRIKTETERLLENRFKSLPRSLGLFPKYEPPEIELHHPYTQNQSNRRSLSSSSSIPSTQQQCGDHLPQQQETQKSSSRSNGIQSLSENSFHQSTASSHQQQVSSDREEVDDNQYTIEPSSPLHFLCEISPKTIYAKVVYLKITNHSSTKHTTYSIYSSKNLLEFELNEGTLLEHETMEIKIKIQSSTLSMYKRQLHDYPSLYDKILVLMDGRFINELDVHIDFISLEDDEEEEEEKHKGRPKCRYCALEQGYPLHNIQ